MSIEIQIKTSGFCTRRCCLFCGEATNKENTIAAVYEDGQDTGYVVCPDYPARQGCLSASPQVLAERLRARAAMAHADADALDAIAAKLPTLPTMDDWRAADEAYTRERCGDLAERSIGPAVNDEGLVF